jgi:hypothetical protein
MRALWTSGLTSTGSNPFFNELLLKISAKPVEMIARKPQPTSAHGACSREEPLPKLLPAIRICALQVTPIAEEALPETVLIGHLEKTSWDDLVRVHVFGGERNRMRRQCREFRHD